MTNSEESGEEYGIVERESWAHTALVMLWLQHAFDCIDVEKYILHIWFLIPYCIDGIPKYLGFNRWASMKWGAMIDYMGIKELNDGGEWETMDDCLVGEFCVCNGQHLADVREGGFIDQCASRQYYWDTDYAGIRDDLDWFGNTNTRAVETYHCRYCYLEVINEFDRCYAEYVMYRH
jgi:hypothetical protein